MVEQTGGQRLTEREERERMENMTSKSDFSSHCSSIINLTVRVYVQTPANCNEHENETKKKSNQTNSTLVDLILFYFILFIQSTSPPHSSALFETVPVAIVVAVAVAIAILAVKSFQVLYFIFAARKPNMWRGYELFFKVHSHTEKRMAKLSKQQGNDKFTNT